MRVPVGVIVLALSAVAWSQSQPVTWLILIDDLHLQFALATADALLGEAPAGGRSALIYLSNGYLAEAPAADTPFHAAATAAEDVRIFPVTFRRVEYDPMRTPTISLEQWQALMNETAGSLAILGEQDWRPRRSGPARWRIGRHPPVGWEMSVATPGAQPRGGTGRYNRYAPPRRFSARPTRGRTVRAASARPVAALP